MDVSTVQIGAQDEVQKISAALPSSASVATSAPGVFGQEFAKALDASSNQLSQSGTRSTTEINCDRDAEAQQPASPPVDAGSPSPDTHSENSHFRTVAKADDKNQAGISEASSINYFLSSPNNVLQALTTATRGMFSGVASNASNVPFSSASPSVVAAIAPTDPGTKTKEPVLSKVTRADKSTDQNQLDDQDRGSLPMIIWPVALPNPIVSATLNGSLDVKDNASSSATTAETASQAPPAMTTAGTFALEFSSSQTSMPEISATSGWVTFPPTPSPVLNGGRPLGSPFLHTDMSVDNDSGRSDTKRAASETSGVPDTPPSPANDTVSKTNNLGVAGLEPDRPFLDQHGSAPAIRLTENHPEKHSVQDSRSPDSGPVASSGSSITDVSIPNASGPTATVANWPQVSSKELIASEHNERPASDNEQIATPLTRAGNLPVPERSTPGLAAVSPLAQSAGASAYRKNGQSSSTAPQAGSKDGSAGMPPNSPVPATITVASDHPANSSGPVSAHTVSIAASLSPAHPGTDSEAPRSSEAPVAIARETPEALLPQSAIKSARILERNGQIEMRVDVRSEALGPLQLRAIVREGSLGAAIGVSTPEAHAWLTKELPALHTALTEHNVRLEQLAIIEEPRSGGAALAGGFDSDTSQFAQPQERQPSPTRFNGLAEAARDQTTPDPGDADNTGRLSVRV